MQVFSKDAINEAVSYLCGKEKGRSARRFQEGLDGDIIF